MTLRQHLIVGHEKTRAVLDRMIEGNRLPHALIFCGPKSVGKRAVAQSFSRALFKRSDAPENLDNLMRSGSFPDFVVVHPELGKKDISVEAIRSLRDHLRLKPYYAGCKIGIIDDADRMSQAACNSLLMTLEEPPENTYLILISSAAHRLPATILSRCTIINFSLLSPQEVEKVCRQLGNSTEVSDDALNTLIHSCDGSLALADLDRFFDPQTLAIIEPTELADHIANLSRDIHAIEGHLETLNLNEVTAARAVSLAAHLTQDSEQLPFVWLVLRRFLRRQLRSSDGEAAAHWATILEQLLQSERWVRERNVNAPLHLSNLLLEMGQNNA